mgnify:CR=1 FL=1
MARLTSIKIANAIFEKFGIYALPKKIYTGYKFGDKDDVFAWDVSPVKVKNLNSLTIEEWLGEFERCMKEHEQNDSMTVEEFKETVRDGKMFSVKFIKKTNGEVRDMVARRGVFKGVKNDSSVNGSWNRKQQDATYNVLTVFDVNKLPSDVEVVETDEKGKAVKPEHRGAFRRINLDGLLEVKVHGNTYTYNDKQKKLIKQ